VEALFADALDVTYIEPNPAINAFAQSDGEAIRIISGSTSGGAYLVTTPEITTAEDLKGKKIATPQLGNTQDVALRTWLQDEGLTSDTSGGGDVSIVPQANADTLAAFIESDAAQAQKDTNAQIEALTEKPLPEDVLVAAWENLAFTDDPIASSLEQSAKDAEAVGLLEPVDLDGIYDLSILSALLVAAGRPEVEEL